MIKFFQKKRFDLKKKGEVGTYFTYAIGEIVLVVVGILIALQINTWNEARKRSLKEADILTGLKNEITQNKVSLEKLYSRTTEAIDLTDSLLALFHKETITISNSELEVMVAKSVMGGFYSYDPIMGYLNSIINSGKIDIISDKQLLALISQFEAKVNNSKEGTDMFKLLWANQMGPLYKNYVRVAVADIVEPKQKSKFSADFNGFFNDPDVEFWMSHCNSWIESHQSAYEEMLADLNQMLSLIEAKIKQ